MDRQPNDNTNYRLEIHYPGFKDVSTHDTMTSARAAIALAKADPDNVKEHGPFFVPYEVIRVSENQVDYWDPTAEETSAAHKAFDGCEALTMRQVELLTADGTLGKDPGGNPERDEAERAMEAGEDLTDDQRSLLGLPDRRPLATQPDDTATGYMDHAAGSITADPYPEHQPIDKFPVAGDVFNAPEPGAAGYEDQVQS